MLKETTEIFDDRSSNGDSISFDGNIKFPVYVAEANTLSISGFPIYCEREMATVLPPKIDRTFHNDKQERGTING